MPMIACGCEVCASTDPKDKRLRSSIMVRSGATTLVVDTGPDFRYQMLREEVKHLDAVLFTHPHKDHIAGLDDIRAFNYFSKQPMEIYCDSLTEEALRRDFYYAFNERRYPGLPEMELNTIGQEAFSVGDITVQPVPAWHHKMPVTGFRFGAFTYITDANRLEDEAKRIIAGSRVLVINALRKEKHLSHFSLEEAIALASELMIPEVYFTHISHQMGLHAVVEKELPPGVHLAYDKLRLEVKGG